MGYKCHLLFLLVKFPLAKMDRVSSLELMAKQSDWSQAPSTPGNFSDTTMFLLLHCYSPPGIRPTIGKEFYQGRIPFLIQGLLLSKCLTNAWEPSIMVQSLDFHQTPLEVHWHTHPTDILAPSTFFLGNLGAKTQFPVHIPQGAMDHSNFQNHHPEIKCELQTQSEFCI